MAEGGVLGRLHGGEEAEEAAEADVPPVVGEPAAMALAVEAANFDAELAASAAGYFRLQTRFVEIQTEHLHEQRALNLRHLRVRRWREALQLAVQISVVTVAALLALGLLVMLHDALVSRQVVVEAFESPPALAARGLSGKVVASAVLDGLTRLQDAARLSEPTRALRGAWASDIRIDVPETGVSVSELDRMLKTRLGHDLHITGDLVQAADGALELTVRGDGVAPRTFPGAAGEVTKLATEAAEYVFGQAEPAAFATFLNNAGRSHETAAFAQAALEHAPAAQRPKLFNAWANALATTGGSLDDALRLYRQALQLKPDYWGAYNNAMNAAWALGREEEAWRLGQTLKHAAGGEPGRAPPLTFQNLEALTWNLPAWRRAVLADDAQAGQTTSASANGPTLADVAVRLHDPADARLRLQLTRPDPLDPTIPAMQHFLNGRLAEDDGALPAAASEMTAFLQAYADPAVSSQYPGYGCWAAPALEAVGRRAEADAVLARWPAFVDCARFRGDILDARGDWAGARRAYASAVALAPDLPAAELSWGEALLRHGDLQGAAVHLALSARKGPGWADPVKAQGDLAARQGRWGEAAARYHDALALAPAWSAARTGRALALRHGG